MQLEERVDKRVRSFLDNLSKNEIPRLTRDVAEQAAFQAVKQTTQQLAAERDDASLRPSLLAAVVSTPPSLFAAGNVFSRARARLFRPGR